MKVGTLNISGRGCLAGNINNKWNALNQLVREQKIGILALQETHLDDEVVARIHDLYGRRLRVIFSQDEDKPNAQGIAFILNRELVDVTQAKLKVIEPGRAAILTTRWHNESQISILNVYAPNENKENERFWESIDAALEGRTRTKIDVLLGDFNLVEDTLDRLPPKEDHQPAVETLRKVLHSNNLHDGWRTSEPDKRDYTFPQRPATSRSRIDRIYTTEAILQASNDWQIHTTGVPTDHRLATAQLSTAHTPYIGKGRWLLPVALIQDTNFTGRIVDLGRTALEEARATAARQKRTTERNPQTVYRDLKEKIRSVAKEILKAKQPKLTAAINRLIAHASEIQAHPNFESDETMRRDSEAIQGRIAELTRKRHHAVKRATTAHYTLNAETVSKYWSNINKDRRPRDIIYALKTGTTDEPRYETRSDRMAEYAKAYHDSLQYQGVAPNECPDMRRSTIKDALSSLDPPDVRDEHHDLNQPISKGEIEQALKDSKTGKAPGLDGIPYELWTALNNIHKKTDEDEPSFDCIELLRLVYNDVDEHGVEEEGRFSEGWMCPIYKKKDRREIANYRPITLLNSDYKLYTKILSKRLAPIAVKLIHPDQAGFLPGRHITDQTQLCRTIVDYAEATEENGVIVALDQEKAYDKIRHSYLWETLKALGLPEKFITRIKNLYKNAKTVVVINGESSTPFRVVRGVRQGDPLSCLLFDLAIEPLACMIRASALRGFPIPGLAERLIASLFADDTSTFLSQGDKWEDLWSILDRWCEASGARFNKDKTEVIPVGTEEYRAAVIERRQINLQANEPAIPDHVHIARDGEAVRILGAWIGNRVDNVSVWSPAVHKIQTFLTRWGRCHPSMKGKRHIVQMGPGGISQYLTMVQGMPKSIERAINKMVREFVWGSDKPPPVNFATLAQPRDEGGLNILDVEARNEAIEVMWLKRYLTLGDNRPKWAFVVDTILAIRVTKEAGSIRRTAQVNTFMQDWHPAMHSRSKLPEYLKRLLSTAKKHNACFAAVKLSRETKAQLPAWYHISANKQLRRLNNTSLSTCLRDIHGVKWVADLIPLNQHPAMNQTESAQLSCDCSACQEAKARGCRNPERCREAAGRLLNHLSAKWNPNDTPTPDGLTLTNNRKKENAKATEEGGQITFDPSLTLRGGIAEAFRVFTDAPNINNPPAIRQMNGRPVDQETTTAHIITVVEMKRHDRQTRKDRPGFVSYGTEHPNNAIVQASTNQGPYPGERGELAAAIQAARTVPRDAPLHLVGETDCLVDAMIKELSHWEDRGWIEAPNSDLRRSLVNELRQRCAVTTLRKARSSNDAKAIAEARHEAVRYKGNNERTKMIETELNQTFNLSGARLDIMSQRLAYRGIRTRRQTQKRGRTIQNINRTIDHVERTDQTRPTEAEVWQSLHHKDIRRPVSDFLWKCMHEAHRCGDFWTKIQGYEERGQCQDCQVTDSIEHILTKCRSPGQRTIWTLAGKLWVMKRLPWKKPSIEDILSVGLAEWRDEDTRGSRTRSRGAGAAREMRSRRKHAERLWRIIISESTYLVWKLRCERVIGHADEAGWQHHEDAISARWTHMVNERLHAEMEMTHRRFGRKALRRDLVLGTWNGTLMDELALPEDWTRNKRVLVGIGTAPDAGQRAPH